MAPAAPNLPTRFPCWCRAVYSWGGETKRDLGFIEGDLIECLNAGDGSWWMGRLRRDKRMVGLFPSNFVQVLDESFQPGSRSPSPLPQSSGSISSPAKPTPQKSKSVFRKPFQAYYNASQPNPEAAARVLQAKNGGISPSLTPQSSVSKQHRPYASMKRSSNESRPSPPISSTHNRPSSLRTSSPMPPLNSASPSRNNSYVQPASPLPPRNHSYARGVSPMPTRNESYMRTTSPMPARQDSYLRTASPMPARQDSYIRTASPMPARQDSYIRTASPMSARHDPYAHTGSPLRSRNNSYDRAASPMPIPDTPSYVRPYSRAHSPAPSFQHHSRSPSPNPYAQEPASSPPPPPPPHRVAYNPSRAPSPAPYDDYREEGYHTPEPPTHDRGFTPSPLTTAMNDVMSSLQDMGLPQSGVADHAEHTPPSIWSPEAFDQAYAASAKKHRPQTSLGIGAQEEEPQFGGSPYDVRKREPDFSNNQQGDEYFHRMESRLKKMHEQEGQRRHSAVRDDELHFDPPPPPPPKRGETFSHAPQMSVDETEAESSESRSRLRKLKNRKSAYELGREVLGRTFTTKSSVTTASSTAPSTTTQSSTSTQQTQHSLMSGISAGGFSATSAGSFARRKWALGARPASAMGPSRTPFQVQEERPETPFTGVTYHSSHASQQSGDYQDSAGGLLGGLTSPKPKKSGFFKKMKDTVKTGAANARSTIASSGQSSRPVSRQKNILSNGIAGISGPSPSGPSPSPTRDLGLANIDWVQVRRDVNRSNSLSKNERNERAERCQMMDLPVINPIDILMESAEGDESLDGLPISEPMDFTNCNLSLVDKSARFVNSLPPMTNPTSLAQGFVCRPYRSDIQRLRAIFTWVSERVAWEEDFEGDIDSRRVIQTRRGCAEEIAVLVMEMCSAVGIHAEVIRGYLKTPGEVLDLDLVARPNHWWNAVIVEGEWRIMDCCLANPSNPKRSKYSSTSGQAADGWWFLARPMEICYTHVPLLPEQQHIVPPMAHEILMALPCACPPYFKNGLRLTDFDTSVVQLEDLEQAHIHFSVPDDVECVAEVEAQAYAKDADGDFFESGDVVRKSALAQAEWVGGQKRYTIKALLPGDEGQGMLKVYAGKRGLMHSIKSNPHPLAFALPIVHHGQNPPYDFVIRHPTPHAQRHDLYVAQPQCLRLAVNNTFVFAVRQHPSSLSCPSPNLNNNGGGINRTASPGPIARPTSSLSMTSASTSAYSNSSSGMPSEKKPAKLAIQSPAGKIIRLMRRSDYNTNAGSEGGDGGVWETVIKIGERGTWRGLVLADRTARWCVFAEWECF